LQQNKNTRIARKEGRKEGKRVFPVNMKWLCQRLQVDHNKEEKEIMRCVVSQ